MGLAQALESGPKADPRTRCGVGDWEQSLSPDLREALASLKQLALAHAGGWNMAKLYREVLDDGLTLRYNAFASHLKGGCSCGDR